MMHSPNDHVISVDDFSQGSVFQGKAVAYDDAGSAFKAVDEKTTTKHISFKNKSIFMSTKHTDVLF